MGTRGEGAPISDSPRGHHAAWTRTNTSAGSSSRVSGASPGGTSLPVPLAAPHRGARSHPPGRLLASPWSPPHPPPHAGRVTNPGPQGCREQRVGRCPEPWLQVTAREGGRRDTSREGAWAKGQSGEGRHMPPRRALPAASGPRPPPAGAGPFIAETPPPPPRAQPQGRPRHPCRPRGTGPKPLTAGLRQSYPVRPFHPASSQSAPQTRLPQTGVSSSFTNLASILEKQNYEM